ncbi:MAG: hypothetical protein AB8H47_00770 [Bacteroidia bacterium]
MKNKEWKVALVMFWILGLTAFFYFKPESPNSEKVALQIASEIDPSIEIKLDSTAFEMPSFQRDAQEDINNGIVRIYIPGGIVSQENKNRALMEKRFGIGFREEACVRKSDPKELHAYNKIVFAYLDKKYGDEWRELLSVETY